MNEQKLQKPSLDWPHAPIHRLTENGTFIVTASTYRKEPLFNTPTKLRLLQKALLSIAYQQGWQLEAWAIFPNHYHFIAQSPTHSSTLTLFLRELHSRTALALNRHDRDAGRKVWHNFWETQLTHERSYLARLNYVHQNPVKHGLVSVANQYPYCSAAWFERTATPAQIKTIYGFAINRIQLPDDY
ncbi:MAG: hypothetical protein B9S26_15260 [Opitutia bacterium Tous-C4FEB]|nr:MAG: hypothetical protein B9S26_15260 [Opitutae bacterium Tous-C4FEB]